MATPAPAIPLRLPRPRVAPVADSDATPAQAAAMAPFARDGRILNIFRTLARAPEALEAFLPWGSYVLSRRNSLSARQREIVILRVGAQCRAGYEFAQHSRIGRNAGLSDAEIARLRTGDATGWAPAEALLVQAADDIVADQFVQDSTWAGLCAQFSERQAMDVVFTAAGYVLVSTFLNSFGVQLER